MILNATLMIFWNLINRVPNSPFCTLQANEDLNRHGMYVLGAIKKIVNKIDDTEYLEKLFDDLRNSSKKPTN